MFRNAMIGVIAAAMLCACGTPVRKDGATVGPNDAYFVLGIAPENIKIQVFPGSMNADGRFQQSALGNAVLNARADQGYAVGKAKPGTTLAITRVYTTESVFNPGLGFVPCQEAQTVVFTPEKGKVVYVTDLDYRQNGDRLEIAHGRNLDGASKYLAANYPQLAALVEQGEFQLAKTTVPCSTTMKVTIYIPRK